MKASDLTLNNLQYCYPGGADALRGISFAVQPGESVGVVGGNGAGKTTLLRHLNGSLISETGMVKVAGIDVTRRNLNQVRALVGMVFKDPDDQLFMPTVEEDVAFGPFNMGMSSTEVEQAVVSSLSSVDALALRNRSPLHLSSGEKRRVALAAVLAMQPTVLVLDEPTDGLDPRGRRQLIRLLNSFMHTMVIASHDLDFLAETCGRLLVLHEGRLMADSTAEALFHDTAMLDQCHLEAPLSFQSCPVCFARKEA